MTPEKVVQKQFEGFVERDLEKFLSCYKEDVSLYHFPENLPFLEGMEAMIANYKDIFDNSPSLNAQLISRMVFKNKVIDREIITNRKEVREQAINKVPGDVGFSLFVFETLKTQLCLCIMSILATMKTGKIKLQNW